MMKRISTAVAVATALTASLLIPTGASAATEFGDTCSGNKPLTTPYTLTTLTAPPAGLPLTAPTSGIVTKVKVQIGLPLPISIPEDVKLLRASGGNSYTVTAQTTVQVITGQITAEVRMPVQAGERLAMHGAPFEFGGSSFPGYEFFCEAGPGSVMGAVVGDVGVGGSVTFGELPEAQVPLAAVIEPDADHDGFGDETQDKCPQAAALQTACPVIVLDSYALPSGNKAVVLVSSSVTTRVTVSGTAKLPKAPKSAGTSAKAKLKGVSKNVDPGKLTRFTLNFPAPLKSAVAALPAGKSITVKLQASATDVAGRVVTDKSSLKLKGAG